MHGVWKDSIDMLVGTKFDPKLDRNAQAGILYTRFYPKGDAFYYQVGHEPPNTRYYIKWMGDRCKYSLLVSPSDVILSWRYEGVKNPEWDCVTS